MGSNDPVIWFVIVAVVQFSKDRKIGEMDVLPVTLNLTRRFDWL